MNLTEQDRFWSYVLKGPHPEDCWFWVGAIADDGYGRFWVQRHGRQKAVRPQRYAYELATGTALSSSTSLLHSCDIPICVHVDVDPEISHVWPGTHRENMLDRSQKGRHVNGWTALRMRGLPRAERAARSRDLREAVKEFGWDPDRIRAALNGVDPDQPRLF